MVQAEHTLSRDSLGGGGLLEPDDDDNDDNYDDNYDDDYDDDDDDDDGRCTFIFLYPASAPSTARAGGGSRQTGITPLS